MELVSNKCNVFCQIIAFSVIQHVSHLNELFMDCFLQILICMYPRKGPNEMRRTLIPPPPHIYTLQQIRQSLVVKVMFQNCKKRYLIVNSTILMISNSMMCMFITIIIYFSYFSFVFNYWAKKMFYKICSQLHSNDWDRSGRMDYLIILGYMYSSATIRNKLVMLHLLEKHRERNA